jgi:hypothetical protein
MDQTLFLGIRDGSWMSKLQFLILVQLVVLTVFSTAVAQASYDEMQQNMHANVDTKSVHYQIQ